MRWPQLSGGKFVPQNYNAHVQARPSELRVSVIPVPSHYFSKFKLGGDAQTVDVDLGRFFNVNVD